MRKIKRIWMRCLYLCIMVFSVLSVFGGRLQTVFGAENPGAGQMTGSEGYFYVKIIGADGAVTTQRINVSYAKGDKIDGYIKEQEVWFSLNNSSKNNPHNLKVSGLKNGGAYSLTKQGKTVHASKSQGYDSETDTIDPDCPVVLKDGTITTYGKAKVGDIAAYKESAHTVFEVDITYDKEAYTYAVSGGLTGNNENVRMNSYRYDWQNSLSTNTLSQKVYHTTHTETFTLQVNMGQTGVYRPGGVTKDYHATYVVDLRHPALEITYDKNGATSGSTSDITHKITYNDSDDPYNFSTFELKKTGYVKNTGAEWNTRAGGSGTAFNQATVYYATEYKDFTDGETFTKKTLKLYAQWKAKPTEYKVYLHANSPTGYVKDWWVGNTWTLSGQTTASTGQIYSDLSGDVTMTKKYTMGKEYTLPQSLGNIVIPGYASIATGWYTEPAGGDYVVNGKIAADSLEEYINANGEVHLYALWTGNTHTLTFDPNGGTVGTSSVTIKYGTEDYNNVSWNTPIRTGYKFLGWYSAAAGGNMVYDAAGACINEGTYWSGNICVYDGDYTVYAHWEPSTYTVHFEGNGATAGNMNDMICTYDVDYTLTPNAYSRTGYTFTGWNTAANGTGTAYKDKQSFKNLGDITLYAQWKINSYKVILHAGIGVENVSGEGTYPYGSQVKIAATVKNGYHWKNWTGTYEINVIEYSFTMPARDVELTANAEANQYTIHFEPNGGEVVTVIPDIVTRFDEDVVLPDVLTSGAYTKMTEYGPSIFLGWDMDASRVYTPTYTGGQTVRNLTDEDNGTVVLYAIWDDCPWIIATDLYYTLDQAQSGYITMDELLSHASAYDREDGEIPPGLHEFVQMVEEARAAEAVESVSDVSEDEVMSVEIGGFSLDELIIPEGAWTLFTIPDYAVTDFTQFQHEGSVTETYEVTDSVGNKFRKQITVYIVDTDPVAVEAAGTTRFINRKYYDKPYEYGGLRENSLWKTDAGYQTALLSAFNNLENNTPIEAYKFSFEEIQDMKEFVNVHGVGNSKEAGALQSFYSQYVAPNRVQ